MPTASPVPHQHRGDVGRPQCACPAAHTAPSLLAQRHTTCASTHTQRRMKPLSDGIRAEHAQWQSVHTQERNSLALVSRAKATTCTDCIAAQPVTVMQCCSTASSFPSEHGLVTTLKAIFTAFAGQSLIQTSHLRRSAAWNITAMLCYYYYHIWTWKR